MKKRIFGYLFFLVAVFFLSVSEPQAAEAQSEAPDFKLEDVKGNAVTLSSYQGKEAVVLLFWTTWCPYCLRELKNLNGMYQELKKDGFEVLAVNVGEPLYKVDNFAKSYRLSYRVLLDKDQSVSRSYGVVGIPLYLIVDKKGKVRFLDNYFPYNKYKEWAAQ